MDATQIWVLQGPMELRQISYWLRLMYACYAHAPEPYQEAIVLRSADLKSYWIARTPPLSLWSIASIALLAVASQPY